jgi:hypothetical protein
MMLLAALTTRSIGAVPTLEGWNSAFRSMRKLYSMG